MEAQANYEEVLEVNARELREEITRRLHELAARACEEVDTLVSSALRQLPPNLRAMKAKEAFMLGVPETATLDEPSLARLLVEADFEKTGTTKCEDLLIRSVTIQGYILGTNVSKIEITVDNDIFNSSAAIGLSFDQVRGTRKQTMSGLTPTEFMTSLPGCSLARPRAHHHTASHSPLRGRWKRQVLSKHELSVLVAQVALHRTLVDEVRQYARRLVRVASILPSDDVLERCKVELVRGVLPEPSPDLVVNALAQVSQDRELQLHHDQIRAHLDEVCSMLLHFLREKPNIAFSNSTDDVDKHA